jgi:23S rRNA G2069 N7-methylase RlmK/C1962 C5-methylase RlmI
MISRAVSPNEVPIDEAFWRARLEAAIRFRDSLQINATAFRLVHGEADLLPSLIVDRYDNYLVIQTLCQGMDRRPAGQAARRNHRRQGHPRAQRSEGRQVEGLIRKRSPLRHRAGDALSMRPASPTPSIRGAGKRPACSSTSERTGRRLRATHTAG